MYLFPVVSLRPSVHPCRSIQVVTSVAIRGKKFAAHRYGRVTAKWYTQPNDTVGPGIWTTNKIALLQYTFNVHTLGASLLKYYLYCSRAILLVVHIPGPTVSFGWVYHLAVTRPYLWAANFFPRITSWLLFSLFPRCFGRFNCLEVVLTTFDSMLSKTRNNGGTWNQPQDQN
jgi:hypothetical protein